MPANLENSAVATGLLRPVFIPMKRSVLIPIPKKGSTKECSNYCTIAFISHAGKVMLKILQARLQQYVNWELPGVQTGLRKGRGIRDQIANICWIIEKAKESPKNICFIDFAKAFDCVDHNKLWEIVQGDSEGQGSLVNHSPWGVTKSWTWLSDWTTTAIKQCS